MSDNPATMTPEQQRALEEAKQKFEELKAQLGKATGIAKDTVQKHLLVARERQQFAERELERARSLRERLEAHKGNPQVVEHHTKMAMLERIYDQMKQMMAIEVAIQERNLKEIEAIPPLEMREDWPVDLKPQVFAPHEDLGYLEHRVQMDVALLEYHWYRNRRGLDVLLRAAGIEVATFEGSEEEQAEQATAVEALKAAMAEDKELQMLVQKLGSELEEAYALLDWARSSTETLGQLPPQAKKDAFADADWKKLNGRLTQLIELAERVHGVPALATHFPYLGKVGLPYEHTF